MLPMSFMFVMEKLLEALISILIIVVVAAAIFPGSFNLQNLFMAKENLPVFSAASTTTTITGQAPSSVTAPREVQMYVPAVDDSGKGAALTLTVQAQPGDGRILTDINNLVFWTDTQDSIRTAEQVAQNVTNVDLSKIDLIYNVKTNATSIEGPSAGAALTIATIAALEGKTPNPNVMITGTINPDGTIGPVGAVDAKAQAAKEIGATTFLVPEGQSVQKTYEPSQNCQTIGPVSYCSTDYQTKTVNITTVSGLNVKEVSNIQEALKYFLK